MESLHLMHININGLRAKAHELTLYAQETNPDIICINETRLRSEAKHPSVAGYQLVARRDRSSGKIGGGGVAIYTKLELCSSDISPDIDDVVVIQIPLSSGSFLTIASVYSAPTSRLFCPLFLQTIQSLIQQHRQLVILGDLNARHHFFGDDETNFRGDQLFSMTEKFDLMVLNDPDQPTRQPIGSKGTIIDYIIATKDVMKIARDCWVGEDVGSDHFPVHATLSLVNSVPSRGKNMIRPLSKCNWELFRSSLDAGTQVELNVESTDDIDKLIHSMESDIIRALDTACPLKKVPAFRLPVAASTLALIKLKRRVRKKAQKDPSLKRLSNKLNDRVKMVLKAERG